MSDNGVSGGPVHVDPDVLDVRTLLTGRRLLVMGGTGFLGKVWLSLLLSRFPEIGHIYLMVREKRDENGDLRQSSEARFWRDVASAPPLQPVRELHPGPTYEAFLREKITPIPGDIGEAYCGVPEEVRAALRGKVDVLLNVAGVVDFEPPLDYALKANAFGMQNLVALARDLGDVKVCHTSTCYVAGDRTGQIDEVHPLTFPFPRADELDPDHWDPEREIAECVDMVDNVRHRSNDAFRQSEFLATAKKNLVDRGEPARGGALQDEIKKVKRKYEEQRLVAGGMERARFWGWHNTYTYTKSLGEQILCTSGLTFTIMRPAVIESALEFPHPGWCEGINTSAPLIYLALVGQLQVPVGEHSVLDVIPVDQVSVGMILALAELIEGSNKPVYQLGSSDSAPMTTKRMVELVGLFKRQTKLKRSGGNPLLNELAARLEVTAVSVDHYQSKGPAYRKKLAESAKGFLDRFNQGPLVPVLDPAVVGLAGLSKSMGVIGKISDTFLPFTATHNYRFSCANVRAAHGRLPGDQAELLPWKPETIDWRHYMLEVHGPGIDKNVVPLIEEKLEKKREPLRSHDTLVEMLEELVDRHDLAPALLRTHEDGFTRITFRDLRDRAWATAARLRRAGVEHGDRVLLSGANHPDWAIAYFGILRAGATAVPLDPALTADQVRVVCASSEPVAAILDEKAREAFGDAFRTVVDAKGHTGPRGMDLRAGQLDLHVATEWGPTDALPKLEPRPEHLASILYTSGTTGTPKGVMLTHANFVALLASLAKIFPIGEEDRVLSVLPLHHAFEFSAGLMLPLSQGARILYLDEINGDRLSHGLREGRITCMVGVPALWQLLERRIRSQVTERGERFEVAFDAGLTLNRAVGKQTGLDIGRLMFGSVHSRLGGNIRMLISGGAALPRETHELFSGLGLHLAEGYGLTEAAPVLTATLPKPGQKAGHVGEAIPGVQVRIADPNDAGIGEVQARGPNVMAGYFGNREATDAVFDADGWLRTGDLGRMDHKGRLHLVGRAKEVVVTSSGENIYLDDVEITLGTIPWVKEYSLVGLPDPRGGERLGMLAVPDTENSDHDRATVRTRATDAIKDAVGALPPVQRPAVVHLVDADLPRTATRKVKRSEVTEILQKIVAAAPSRLPRAGSLGGPVIHAVATVAGIADSAVSAESRMADDLGFDSLMWVELASALENLGTGRPDADALARCETVADVVALARAPAPEVAPDDDEHEAVKIPEVIAQPLKSALGWGQRTFYTKGLNTTIVGEAFIPQNRQTIVVCNHTSHLDMGLIKISLGKYGRAIVGLAAKDYFFEGNPWMVAYFSQLTNLKPIDRKAGFRASFEQAREIVEAGNVVLIFPEGTRRVDGQLGEWKPLVGKLSLETGVDILPLHLDGTYDILPKGARVPRGRDVTVRIGPPLRVEDLHRLTAGMKSGDAARTAAELARSAVEHLSRGAVLDLSAMRSLSGESEAPKEWTIEQVFKDLEGRYDPQRVERAVTWYFSLGESDGPRWTVAVDKVRCLVKPGRPDSGKADCVVKTSQATFKKIVRDAYIPTPDEFISGSIKTNDIPLLIELSRVFALSDAAGQLGFS